MNSNEVKGMILLVDDNQADIVLTTRELKDISVNTQVVAVHGGQEALDYLFGKGSYTGRNTSELPILIILDLRMPGLDGLDVLKKIRESPLTMKLPVMLFTMDDFDTERIRSQTPGCAYVHKPLDFKQFSAAAEELELSWLVRRDSLAAKTS